MKNIEIPQTIRSEGTQKEINKIPISLEEWELDEKRFEEQLLYYERRDYRCTLINKKGLIIKCTKKNCAFCNNYWSKKINKVSSDYLFEEFDLEFPSAFETPVSYVNRIETHDIIEKAIESLPSNEMRLITRLISFSYSFQEIGVVLGISKVAVFKKWKTIRELLRDYLRKFLV